NPVSPKHPLNDLSELGLIHETNDPTYRTFYKKEYLGEEYMKNRGKYNCFDEANNCLFSICLLLFFHTKISSIG
ncbi:hypothetical protein, partial [Enterococcus faecium]|uniref:hypothetical protein n=1 Tax=Enterococcus faecium TaxID=1352 RepID=UPI0011B01150